VKYVQLSFTPQVQAPPDQLLTDPSQAWMDWGWGDRLCQAPLFGFGQKGSLAVVGQGFHL
jgi:hypothetical protein